MYYISTTKAELEAYNEVVCNGQNYGRHTTRWADVIEHPNSKDFALYLFS